MRILKLALYTLAALAALYCGICAIAPATFTADKSITINAAPEKVFAYVADYNRWFDWSAWKASDPAMTNVVEGIPGTVGHKQTWKSKKEGDGAQFITELTPNKHIKMGLSLMPDDPSDINYSDFHFSGDSTKTTVKWTMTSSPVPFPGRGAVYLMGIEKMLNGYFERSLTALKAVVEKG
jgi:uncharacterized protein YndB with AHSA1/START domain